MHRKPNLYAILVVTIGLALIGCTPYPPKKESTQGENANPEASQKSTETGTIPQSSGTDPAARAVLEACIAKYKRLKSYEDRGVLKVRIPFSSAPVEENDVFQVAFQAPNHVAIRAQDIRSSWTGSFAETIIGNDAFRPFENQRQIRPLPETLSLDWLLADNLVTHFQKSPIGVPIQLQLLLDTKPLAYWFDDTTQLKLLAPGSFDNAKCDRVQVVSKLGNKESAWILWIDQSSRLLRKYELPFEIIEILYASQGGLPENVDKTKAELSIELVGARGDESIDWSSWTLPKATNDLLVSRFIDPPPRNFSPLLGATIKPFDLFDADRKPIFDSSQRKKPISILLWIADDAIGEKFANYVMSVRQDLEKRGLLSACEMFFVSQSPGKDMAAAFKRWNCDLPLAIDVSSLTVSEFGLKSQPAVVVLDKNVRVQFVSEQGYLGAIPAIVDALKNGEDPASRTLQNRLDDEARYTSRLHRATIEKSQLDKLNPIEPFPFYFHATAEAWHQSFREKIIAAGGERFYVRPDGTKGDENLFARDAKSMRLMTALDENGYVYSIDNQGTQKRIAKIPVEQADNAKRIQVLPDPWSHRWIAIVPEGLPRYWLIDMDDVSTDAEPPDATQFDLKEAETITTAAWTVRGAKSSLTLATNASKLIVLDPQIKKPLKGDVGEVVSIFPSINEKSQVVGWNVVDSHRTISEIGDLPTDGNDVVPTAEDINAPKQTAFVPLPGAWTWGMAGNQSVLVSLTQLPTGEAGSIVQSNTMAPGLLHPLSVRPEQCRILASTTLSNGAFYWLATAPNRVLHLQTLQENIADQMSLSKRVLGATIVPEGNDLRIVIATDSEITCFKLVVPKPNPTPNVQEAISPSEKSGG